MRFIDWSGFAQRGTWGMLTSSWAAHLTTLSAAGTRSTCMPCPSCASSSRATTSRPLMQPRLHTVSYRHATHVYQRRASCCRFYLVPEGELCASCPLVSQTDRLARNLEWMQRQIDARRRRRAGTDERATALRRRHILQRRQELDGHGDLRLAAKPGRVGRAIQGAEHVEQLVPVCRRRRDRPRAGGAGRSLRARARAGHEPDPAEAERERHQPGHRARTGVEARSALANTTAHGRCPARDGAGRPIAIWPRDSTSSSSRARAVCRS